MSDFNEFDENIVYHLLVNAKNEMQAKIERTSGEMETFGYILDYARRCEALTYKLEQILEQ